MRVGFHSPMPPERSGVADYSAALLEALRKHAEAVVNPRQPAEAELYHLGNNKLHRQIYKRALKRPGVAVLHDAELNHFFLGLLDEEAYVEEFVYNYGEWSREQARQLWEGRARSAQDPKYFRYPMLRRVAEVSRAVVVHNPSAASRVREHAPGSRVVEIPHLFRPPNLPPESEIIRLRVRLGVAPSATLFGVFGHLRESKRLLPILRAFQQVRRDDPKATLLVAGEFASPDLERAAAPFFAEPSVVRAGYLSEDEFWLYAAAVDVCINLRYPAAGETSGIGVRMMGIGKATIMTAGEEISRLPENACLKVDAGVNEEEMLAEYMLWLARFPQAAREIGRRAAAHIKAEHSLERCAKQYLAVLSESTG